jgi:hypothetical protein
MKQSSREFPIPVGFASGNQFVQKGSYAASGVLAGSMLHAKLYPVSPGAATHHVVRVSDERVTRLEKELADLRAQVERQAKARQVTLAVLGGDRFRLRQPLWVELDSSGEHQVTAHVSDLEEYGTGSTDYEALEDLRAVLVETYSFLLENASSLGPGLAAQLRRFHELMEIV